MLRNIEAFLGELFDNKPAEITDEEELRIACAALLVHCARADGLRSEAEDTELRHILSAHYKLSDDDVERTITTAQSREADAVDIHRFTRVLHQRLDRNGRRQIVKFLWQVAHADGNIDHDERRTVALAAQLLDVEVRDSVALRQAAVDASDD